MRKLFVEKRPPLTLGKGPSAILPRPGAAILSTKLQITDSSGYTEQALS